MNKWIKFAKIYSIASVFIGPAIVLLLGGNHPSGWDCTDFSWSNEISITEREAIYENGSRFMGPAAIVMLIIGVILLAALIYFGVKNKTLRALPLSLITTVMLLGYVLILLIATTSWC